MPLAETVALPDPWYRRLLRFAGVAEEAVHDLVCPCGVEFEEEGARAP